MASKKGQNPFNVLDPGTTDSNDFFSSIKNGFDNGGGANANSFFNSPFNTSPAKNNTLAFDQFAASMKGKPSENDDRKGNNNLESIFNKPIPKNW